LRKNREIFYFPKLKMSSSIEFVLSGPSPKTGANSNIGYVYDSQNNQVKIGYTEYPSQVAVFNIPDPSQLYLGDFYAPQVKIGDNLYYLDQVSPQDNKYNLVIYPTPRSFGFIPPASGNNMAKMHNFPKDVSLNLISKTPIPLPPAGPVESVYFNGQNSSVQMFNSTPACNPECTNGQICVNGTCQDCSATNLCPAGQTCVSGKCQKICNPACTGGQVCVNGTCQGCSQDIECPTGQVCNGGKCVPKCTSTSCPNGQVCIAGKCQKCTNSAQCPSGYECQNGACTKKPIWKNWWFWVIIAVLILILILVIIAIIYALV
jgi:Cys-rich repeat protein